MFVEGFSFQRMVACTAHNSIDTPMQIHNIFAILFFFFFFFTRKYKPTIENRGSI
jgi:hypothetical protein